MKRLAASVLISALAAGALAHSKLASSAPRDGVTLSEAPAEISLDFNKKIRLTRVEMTHREQPAVQLELGDQTGFERAFTLPMEAGGTGLYRIEWRGLGVDGHAMQGGFSFTVE